MEEEPLLEPRMSRHEERVNKDNALELEALMKIDGMQIDESPDGKRWERIEAARRENGIKEPRSEPPDFKLE